MCDNHKKKTMRRRYTTGVYLFHSVHACTEIKRVLHEKSVRADKAPHLSADDLSPLVFRAQEVEERHKGRLALDKLGPASLVGRKESEHRGARAHAVLVVQLAEACRRGHYTLLRLKKIFGFVFSRKAVRRAGCDSE